MDLPPLPPQPKWGGEAKFDRCGTRNELCQIYQTIYFKEKLFCFFRIRILRATNFSKGSNLYDPWLTYQYRALFFRKYVFLKMSSDCYEIWIE